LIVVVSTNLEHVRRSNPKILLQTHTHTHTTHNKIQLVLK
jgi:hypothetical protein